MPYFSTYESKYVESLRFGHIIHNDTTGRFQFALFLPTLSFLLDGWQVGLESINNPL